MELPARDTLLPIPRPRDQEEDLTRDTEASLATITILDTVDLHLAGTLTLQPPAMTCTTEDTQAIPHDQDPTRDQLLRADLLLLLPVRQEHLLPLPRLQCPNLMTSTR